MEPLPIYPSACRGEYLHLSLYKPVSIGRILNNLNFIFLVSAPVFHDMVGTMFTNPGESLSLRCQVYGNPLPTVQWLLFDEQVVGEADRVKVRYSRD